jgi:hypothetical protein
VGSGNGRLNPADGLTPFFGGRGRVKLNLWWPFETVGSVLFAATGSVLFAAIGANGAIGAELAVGVAALGVPGVTVVVYFR